MSKKSYGWASILRVGDDPNETEGVRTEFYQDKNKNLYMVVDGKPRRIVYEEADQIVSENLWKFRGASFSKTTPQEVASHSEDIVSVFWDTIQSSYPQSEYSLATEDKAKITLTKEGYYKFDVTIVFAENWKGIREIYLDADLDLPIPLVCLSPTPEGVWVGSGSCTVKCQNNCLILVGVKQSSGDPLNVTKGYMNVTYLGE